MDGKLDEEAQLASGLTEVTLASENELFHYRKTVILLQRAQKKGIFY